MFNSTAPSSPVRSPRRLLRHVPPPSCAPGIHPLMFICISTAFTPSCEILQCSLLCPPPCVLFGSALSSSAYIRASPYSLTSPYESCPRASLSARTSSLPPGTPFVPAMDTCQAARLTPIMHKQPSICARSVNMYIQSEFIQCCLGT